MTKDNLGTTRVKVLDAFNLLKALQPELEDLIKDVKDMEHLFKIFERKLEDLKS